MRIIRVTSITFCRMGLRHPVSTTRVYIPIYIHIMYVCIIHTNVYLSIYTEEKRRVQTARCTCVDYIHYSLQVHTLRPEHTLCITRRPRRAFYTRDNISKRPLFSGSNAPRRFSALSPERERKHVSCVVFAGSRPGEIFFFTYFSFITTFNCYHDLFSF